MESLFRLTSYPEISLFCHNLQTTTWQHTVLTKYLALLWAHSSSVEKEIEKKLQTTAPSRRNWQSSSFIIVGFWSINHSAGSSKVSGTLQAAKNLHGDKLRKGHPGILLPRQCLNHLLRRDNEVNTAGVAGSCVTVSSRCGAKTTSFE